MPTFTPFLNLLKKIVGVDPSTDKFNIQTMLNDNWDKIDTAMSDHVGAGGAAHADVVAGGASGFMTGAQATKLNGIAAGAEVNQNAFSTVAVSGQSNVVADSKTDTLTIAAGTGIDITTNATTDTVTVAGKAASTTQAGVVQLNDTTTSTSTTQAATANAVKVAKDAADAASTAASNHAAETAPHSATSAATASRIVMRDANGRAKVAAPAASDDIARKNEVDAVQTNLQTHDGLTTAHGATSAATASRIAIRDANGRAQFATPSADADAATKGYVDETSAPTPVRAATTANITLSGAQTIDGVAVVVGDRVLVKNQTTASQNGIYTVAAGAWTRTSDADTAAKHKSGMTVRVAEGSTQGTTTWTLTTTGAITLGTTALAFAQLAAPADGTTLEFASKTIRIKDSGVTDAKIGNRTADPNTATAYALTGSVTQFFSWILKYLKSLSGKPNPFDAPAISLETVSGRLNQAVNTTSTPTFAGVNLGSTNTYWKLLTNAAGRGSIGSANDNFYVEAAGATYMTANATLDNNGVWQRRNTAQPSVMLEVFHAYDAPKYYKAVAGTGSPSWVSYDIYHTGNSEELYKGGYTVDTARNITSGDVNAIVEPGIYYLHTTGISNVPVTGYAYLEVFAYDANHIVQRWCSASDAGFPIYERRKWAGTWGAWDSPTALLRQSAFFVSANYGQNISANTWTRIIGNVENYDHLAEYNTSTGIFTAAEDGVYHFSLAARITSVSAGNNVILRFMVNGTGEHWVFESIQSYTGEMIAQGDITIKLAAGQTAEFQIYTTQAVQFVSGFLRETGVRVA